MSKRATDVVETRQRIVEAAVTLHGTVGPSGTTIVGIAHEARVTRATVYRHFPDDDALFQACAAHWLAGQTPPNPALWAQIEDPAERTRAGLTDIYRFFRDGESMLTRIYRDKALLPPKRRADIDARDNGLHELLLSGWPVARGRRQRLSAALGHAASFWTWRSLCVDQALSNADAVELMVGLAEIAHG
jgi:AcrR family transcriptional regulator